MSHREDAPAVVRRAIARKRYPPAQLRILDREFELGSGYLKTVFEGAIDVKESEA